MSKPEQLQSNLLPLLTWEQMKKLQRDANALMRPIVERHEALVRAGRGFLIHDEFVETYVPPERR